MDVSSSYVELQVTTNYSFLRGASHPEELMATARLQGHAALAVTDRNTLSGIARSHQRAREAGVRLVVGCRLELTDGVSVLAYPENKAGWSRLCRLLTQAKRNRKQGFDLGWDRFRSDAGDLLVAMIGDRPDERRLGELREAFGDRAWLAMSWRRRPDDAQRLQALSGAARAARVRPLAVGDVLYHAPPRRILQDVVTCIREGCTIDAAGFRRERSVDRHLKPPTEMMRLFERHPDAVEATGELAGRARFSLDALRYQYPSETVPGETAQETLARLCREGASRRYPDGVPAGVASQLGHELALIGTLDYAAYFLTVGTIVAEARRRGILCQGRGSAANSVVCYVLGITAIDPVQSSLLFERFISAERHEPPDIDVDFEHERREEMIQFVYDHYGRERAALCATVMRFRSRGAVRDVGRVMGLTEDVTGALASQVWGWSEEGVDESHAAGLNLNVADRRLRLTLEIAKELIGFPRQLGTHPGGFVLTQDRLTELVPIEPAAMDERQIVVWDKDDIDTLRWMKVDVLGLGMLGCMRRAFELLAAHRGLVLEMATIPKEDPVTYAMITRADTLGTFQIESRAQMSMLPRMKPRTLYDLVIEVAVVRPGPIQGDMVHPYLRRREGLEPVTYPTEDLRRVLEKTLGVPLFQEQAMQVAIVCAGFTPGEADQLRRSMATFKMTGGVGGFRDKMIGGMVARGYDQAFAERTFSQIEGFGSYGFPESHAASFALIAYASAWMKCHHPDVFCAALLNAQPMGFYAPAQIVRCAREHGVAVRAVSINESGWDCTLEASEGPMLAVRLGMRMARGLSEMHALSIIRARGGVRYRSVEEVWRRSSVPAAALAHLARADAFGCFGLTRRAALWEVEGLAETALPLFVAADRGRLPRPEIVEASVTLPAMTDGGEVVADYRSVGLSLRRHPLSFLRAEFEARGMVRCADLERTRNGRRVTVPGIVLMRQKPGSAKGVMFITVEDETGIANVIVWPSLFERQRRMILSASTLGVRGVVQREGGVIHVLADALIDLSEELRRVGERGGGPFEWPTGRGDEARHGGAPDQRQGPIARPRDLSWPAFAQTGIKVTTRDFR